MSGQLVGEVLEHSKARGTARLVLVALADRAHYPGRTAYPSVADLATRVNESPRSVQRALRILEDAGELLVDSPGGGRGRTSHYRVAQLGPDSEGCPERHLSNAENGDARDTVPQERVSPEAERVSPEARNGVASDTRTGSNRKEPSPPVVLPRGEETPDFGDEQVLQRHLLAALEPQVDNATRAWLEHLRVVGWDEGTLVLDCSAPAAAMVLRRHDERISDCVSELAGGEQVTLRWPETPPPTRRRSRRPRAAA